MAGFTDRRGPLTNNNPVRKLLKRPIKFRNGL